MGLHCRSLFKEVDRTLFSMQSPPASLPSKQPALVAKTPRCRRYRVPPDAVIEAAFVANNHDVCLTSDVLGIGRQAVRTWLRKQNAAGRAFLAPVKWSYRFKKKNGKCLTVRPPAITAGQLHGALSVTGGRIGEAAAARFNRNTVSRHLKKHPDRGLICHHWSN
jgi:hypothetical protein